MNRIKREDLNNLVAEICKQLGLANNPETAKVLGLKKYLFLEYAPIYGGYRIVNVGIDNGAHYGAFGGNGTEARLKASEMAIKLKSILDGIEATKKMMGVKQEDY